MRIIILNHLELNHLKGTFLNFLALLIIIFLDLVISCIFTSQGNLLINNSWIFTLLLIPMVLFFIINFIIGRVISKLFNLNYEDSITLNLITLARNPPIALAIAVTVFSNQLLIALTLIICTLIELPLLAIFSQILLLIRKKEYNVN